MFRAAPRSLRMCSHSCKHAFVIRHTGNIRRDSTRGTRVAEREREKERGHATLCGSWFFKITIRQISHFATFLKNVVLALEWAARERENREVSRGGRGESCSPYRGACARVSFVRRILVCCAQVSSPCPIPEWKYLKFYSFTISLSVFSILLQLFFNCLSLFLSFGVSIEFTN